MMTTLSVRQCGRPVLRSSYCCLSLVGVTIDCQPADCVMLYRLYTCGLHLYYTLPYAVSRYGTVVDVVNVVFSGAYSPAPQNIAYPQSLRVGWTQAVFFELWITRPPGTAVPDGLMFYRRCIFFRHAFSEVPRPIALTLCHMIRIWPYFIIPLQKFGGRSPQKIGGQNMQNFGQFWTTSEFDREYLRNGSRYPKSADVTNYGNSSCV